MNSNFAVSPEKARKAAARAGAGQCGVLPYEGSYATRAQIAADAGMAESSVRKRIQQLRAKGVRKYTRKDFS